jgi:polyribonucleotide nucleotidyltransferase
MASACAGSLALYDAGVKLKAPVAGIAIGIFHKDGEVYKPEESGDLEDVILTDLMGMEDYAGDMDFKIAGTLDGFTAMQLDVSIPGLSIKLLRETLHKGRKGLKHILKLMRRELPTPRESFKESVPVFETMPIMSLHRSILFRANAYNAKLIGTETGARVRIWDLNSLNCLILVLHRR